ncbi:MAG: high frequency lysogenization protein HflD [Oleiphilus sp.]
MTPLQQQVIALAGLFQAMEAVDQIAQTGRCNEAVMETAIKSLFVDNPETAISVYGELADLRPGLQLLQRLLSETNTNNKQYSYVRYALAIIQLERKLAKTPEMLKTISDRLEHTQNQVKHFGILHENVFSGIASIYTDTISTFSLRVHIAGHEQQLKITQNADKIRSLLLSGIRSAILWRQLKGHRWQFIFKRKAIIKECEQLLSHISSQVH